ncbi:MAG TPA: 30S ribosomal protein S8 [Candidatus Methylacidiphilales bacterium]|jgi:small subunit ribosomal protein S8|nr:30S ribosomal protein S8 [Candidatus Methylacidiphilales bacterium]
MQSDPLADFLTCIRNAARASKSEVRVPWSRMRSDVAHILKNEGYVTEVEKVADAKAKAGKPELLIKLRGQGKTRAITQITRVSKPGRRQYVGASEIPRVLGGMGISVVSTPRGVMAGHQAKKQNLGGELLLTVY